MRPEVRSGQVRGHLAVSDDPVLFTGPDRSTGEPTVRILRTVAEVDVVADLDRLSGIGSEDIAVHIVDTVAIRI